jgi:hypothetical protein
MGGIKQRSRSGWPLLLVALLLLAAIAAKGLLIQPRIAPSDFDTARAIERLDRILGDQRPHPVDTPANDAVRERLIAELRALGLEAQIQEATDCSGFPKSRTVSCSHVRNVIAIVPGDPSRKALLINAHYDSTPTGPGAADDGIGVAVMLEVANILKSEPLGRPVILLFNEGEEYGLNGAAVFAASPLADRVGSVINIEARGVSGPAIMFETDNPNGRAIADYAASTARPYANSLSADFAKLIPNTTDVVKFKPRGWQTLGYAITGNETRYHSPGDDLAHLDRRSVAQMGSEVLAAARRMAGSAVPASARAIYTDVAGLFLITLPLALGAGLLGGLAVVALALVHRRREWLSLGRLALAFILPVVVAAVVAMAVGVIRPGDYWRAYPWVPTLAAALTVVAAQAWLVTWAAAKADRTQMRLAAWTLVLLLGAAISAIMPGAIIFFLIAPALGLLSVKWPVLAWLGGVIQLVMLGELVALIELTLIDGPTFAVAPLISLISLPFLVEVGRSARWPHMVLALSSLALWAACLVIPRASADRPLAMTIDHVQDERLGTATWAIGSKQAPLPAAFDRFGPWQSGPLPYNKRTRWLAEAPLMEGPRGQLTLISSRIANGQRLLRLKLDRAGADSLLLRFDEDTPVLAMGRPGQRRLIDEDADKGPSAIRCTGRRCDGLEVEILLGTAKPVVAMLVATRFAPPPEAAPLIAARPRNAHPQYSPDSQVRVRAIRL